MKGSGQRGGGQQGHTACFGSRGTASRCLAALLRRLRPDSVGRSCEDTGVRPTTTVQATDSADQVLEGFSHYVTNEGVRRSRVEADTAFYYEPTQITELHKVKVVFFDIKGAEGSTLTAKRGTYRWQDGSMEATGNVRGGIARRAPALDRIAALRQCHEPDHDRQAVHVRQG